MQTLTEIALEHAKDGVFTQSEVAVWVNGSADSRHSLMKRALAAGEIVRLRRGLYCLANRYLRGKPDLFCLAQRIFGPSYVSLESALSYHGWILEAVYCVTCVGLSRSREFATPLGHFNYTSVPQESLFVGVERIENQTGGGVAFVASPLKALADYVYVHKCDWTSTRPLAESLRIDNADIAAIDCGQCGELALNYPSGRVWRFLEGVAGEIRA